MPRCGRSDLQPWHTSFMPLVPSAGTAEFSLIHDRLALGPVDRYVCAVDETGAGRGEKGHQRGDLSRLADAAERYGLGGQLVRPVLGHALVPGVRLLQRVPPVGVPVARVHRVDAHAVTAVLFGYRGG